MCTKGRRVLAQLERRAADRHGAHSAERDAITLADRVLGRSRRRRAGPRPGHEGIGALLRGRGPRAATHTGPPSLTPKISDSRMA